MRPRFVLPLLIQKSPSGWRPAILALLLALLAAGVAALPLDAQSVNSSVEGVIQDPSGAVVPGARIILTNLNTASQTSTESNDVGRYAFPSVPPGTYLLEISKPGFKPVVISDFRVAVAQQATQDIQLELGTAAESVLVAANNTIPLLEPSSNDLGTLIEPTSVKQLPLNGRNYIQLGLLSGATQDSGTSVSDFLTAQTGRSFRAITIAGNQQDMISYMVNGTYAAGSRLGQSALNLSVSALDQFKVQHGFFLPGMGPDPGIVNVITKSGGNRVHGEVFEFVRNDRLDARNFFDPQPRPGPFRRNQFGGAVGGPVIRDKLFFFAHYEGLRQVRSAAANAFAPTARMFAGDFSEILPTQIFDPATFDPVTSTRQPFAGNIIPPDRINPVAKRLLNFYLPGTSYASRPNNVSGNPRTRMDSDQFGARLDAALSTKNSIFGQYIYEDSPVINYGLFPMSGPWYPLTSQVAMVQWTSTLQSNLVHELRLGYTRALLFFTGERRPGLQDELGITGTADTSGPPGITLQGIGQFGRSQSTIGNIDNLFQIHDSLSYLHGNHELKFGFDGRYMRQTQESSNFSARGTIVFNNVFSAQLAPDPTGQLRPVTGTGNSFADFLLGFPTSGTVSSMPRTHFRWTQLEPYLHDSWKLRSGLTINYGLAWYQATPPMPSGQDISYPHAFDFVSGKVKYAALGDVSPQVYATDRNNFAPRLGLAWQPGFSKDFVLRTGWGVYYPSQRSLYQLFAITAPGIAIVQSVANDISKPYPQYVLGQNMFPPITTTTITREFAEGVTGTVYALDTGLRTPYVQQWNFSVQYGLGQHSLVELAYIGSESRKLTNRWNANDCSVPESLICDPSAKRYPQYDVLFFAANEANANYHALTAKFQRQFAHGFSLLANYTWSKTLTNTMQGGATSPLNQRAVCRRCDKGLAGFNVPQRLVASVVWDLPLGRGEKFLGGAGRVMSHAVGGWTLNVITTFAAGNPFIVTAPNLTGAVLTLFRADRLCHGRSSLANRDLRSNGLYWIDPSCFAAPPSGSFGNSGGFILTGPGVNNWDIGIEKNFRLGESMRLQLRGEFFNAWNHAQFMNPISNVADVNFGRVSEARPSREVQLGLKVAW